MIPLALSGAGEEHISEILPRPSSATRACSRGFFDETLEIILLSGRVVLRRRWDVLLIPFACFESAFFDKIIMTNDRSSTSWELPPPGPIIIRGRCSNRTRGRHFVCLLLLFVLIYDGSTAR